MSPTKKEYDDELERELLSVVEDAPPKRPSIKKEPAPPKVPTSSNPKGVAGLQSLPKKPATKLKPKPKEPAQMFMNPNSAAAKVANKKSSAAKQEPKAVQKSSVSSQPTPVSKLAALAGDLKGKGVKREVGPEAGGPVKKRPRPSPPPSKTQPQTKPQISKPPLAAGLPPKPQTTTIPSQSQPQQKPQLPAKKGFSLELPTGSSTGASSSRNPLLAGSGGGTTLSLPTGSSTLGNTQPSSSTLVDTTLTVPSDSESDWDEVDADGPSPLDHQTQPLSEPQPYRFGGALTIEEDPPAGFNGKLDIIDGDEDRYEEEDADGDGEGVDIDMDDLMAEMDEQLQGGGGEQEQEQEGEGEGDDMDDFLFAAVAGQDQGDQDGDVDNYLGADTFLDDESSTSSDDSDD